MSAQDDLAATLAQYQADAQASAATPPPGPSLVKPLGPQPSRAAPPPTPPTATPDAAGPKDFLGRVLDTMNPFSPTRVASAGKVLTQGPSAYLHGVESTAAAAVRAPGQLLGGTLDTMADVGKFVGDNIDARLAPTPLAHLGTAIVQGTPLGQAEQVRQAMTGGASLGDALSMRSSLGTVGNPKVNEFMTQALAAAIPIPGAAEEGILRGAAGTAVKAGLSANAEGATPEDRLEDRLAQAGLGAVTHVGLSVAQRVIAGAVLAGRAGLKTVAATPEEAAQGSVDKTFGTLHTDAARDAQRAAELQAPSGVAPGVTPPPTGEPIAPVTQVTPEGGTESGQADTAADKAGVAGSGSPKGAQEAPQEPGMQPTPLGEDAKALVEHAGAAPDPLLANGATVNPDTGKIIVSGETKATLDGASAGRAFEASPDNVVDLQAIVLRREAAEDAELRGATSHAQAGQDRDWLESEGIPQLEQLLHERQQASQLQATLGLRDQLAGTVGTLEMAHDGLLDTLKKANASQDPTLVTKAARDLKGYLDGDNAKIDRENIQAVLAGHRIDGPSQRLVGPQALHLKETDEAGGSRPIGSPIDRPQMDGLVAHAEAIASDPAHISTDADHPSGQAVLAPLGDSTDVAAFGRAIVDRLPDDERPVSWKETLSKASAEMGVTPDEAIARAASLAGNVNDLAKGVTVTRLLVSKVNNDMGNLRGTDWSTVDLNDPRWTAALTAYHNAYSVMAHFRSIKTEIARGLNSMKIPLNGFTAFSMGVKPEDAIPPQTVPDFDTFIQNFGKTPDAAGEPINPASHGGTGTPTGAPTPPEGTSAPPPPGPASSTAPPAGGTPGLTPKAPGTVPSLPRNAQEFQDAVQLHGLAAAYGPAALNNFWKGVTFTPNAWKYLGTSFANWFTAALVSAPTSFARDLVGPAVMGGLRTFEKGSGFVGMAIDQAVKGNTQGALDNLATAGDAAHAYGRTFGDIGLALRAAWATLKTGDSQLGGAQPYNFNSHGVPGPMIAAASKNVFEQGAYIAGNMINFFPKVVHDLHGGVNEFALHLAYLGETRTAAAIQGRSQGLSGTGLDQYIESAVMASRDPNGLATDGTQLENAQRTTFTKPVGSDTEPRVRSAMATAKLLREEQPALRLILPIMNIPANSFGETLRRIPILGQTMFRGTRQELSGQMGSIAQAEAYGRLVSGAGITTAGFLMSQQGLLTGAGPENPRDRSAWQAAGFQPWSLKGPDGKWYSYNRIDGVGALLGIVAGLHDHNVYHSEDNPNLQLAGVSAVAEYLKDQANLKGISDLLSFGGNPSEDSGALRTMINGWTSGFVPGFLKPFRQMVDPDKRVVLSPWDAIRNAIPGASASLDPVRNLLGEPVPLNKNLAGVLPITTSEPNPQGPRSEVLDEMHRLFLGSGFVPGVLPPGVPGGHFDQRGVKLEDGSSLYDARMRYRGHVTSDDYDGKTLTEALADTIHSDDYKAAYDGTPGGLKETADGDQGNRAAMLEKVFHSYDEAAKTAVSNDSPIAARMLTIAKLKQMNPPGASHYDANTLLHNPALLSQLAGGQGSLSDLEDRIKGN